LVPFRRPAPLDAGREHTPDELSWTECFAALAHETTRLPADAAERQLLINFTASVAQDRLGRPALATDLGESAGTLAQKLREQAQVRSLGSQLLACEEAANDRRNSPEERAASWLEWAILAQRAETSAQRQVEALSAALTLTPNASLALDLIWRCAWMADHRSEAANHLTRLLATLDLRTDPIGADLTLALTHLQSDPIEKKRLLDKLAVFAADHGAPHLEMLLATILQGGKLPVQSFAWLEKLGESINDAQHRLEFEVLASRLVAQNGGKLEREQLERLAFSLDAHDPNLNLAILDDVIDLAACGACGPLENLPPTIIRWLAHAALGADERRDLALRILARGQASARSRNPSRGAETSIQWLERWVELFPADAWAAEIVVDHLRSIGHWQKAKEVLERWALTCTSPQERAAVWLRLAQVFDKLGEVQESIAAVERAYGDCPGDPECTRALGRAYEQAGMWNQAMRVLASQAAERGDVGEQVIALHRLAQLAERGDADTEHALATLARAAELAPDDRTIQLDLASLARRSDRMPLLAEVLTRLTKIGDQARTRAALHHELATILYFRLARRDEALHHFELAHKLAPNHSRFRRSYAEVLARSGHHEPFSALAQTLIPSRQSAALAEFAWIARDQLSDLDLTASLCLAVAQHDPDRLECTRVAVSSLLKASARDQAYALLLKVRVCDADPLVLAETELERFALLLDLPIFEIPDARIYQRAVSHCESALQHAPRHQGALERLRAVLSIWGQLDRLDLHERENCAQDRQGRWISAILTARRAALDPARQRDVAELYMAALGQEDDPCLRQEAEWAVALLAEEKTAAIWMQRACQQAPDPLLRASIAVEGAEHMLFGDEPDVPAAARLTLFALKHDPGNPHAVLLLEYLLEYEREHLPLRQAIGARAVRPQTAAERAIFYFESAKILESAGIGGEAHVAYQAVDQSIAGLSIVAAGMSRTLGDAPRAGHAVRSAAPSEANAAPESAPRRTSQELVVLAGMVARALATRDAHAAESALSPLGRVLTRDPNAIDAVRLAISLARENIQRDAAVELLSQVCAQATNPEVRYEAWLTLADIGVDIEQSAIYYERAADLFPNGKAALEGLLRLARQLGDPLRLSDALDRMLQADFLDSETTQALRREQLAALVKMPGAAQRALTLAQTILQRSPDDLATMSIAVELLDRNRNPAAAAKVLAQLIAVERDQTVLHHHYYRQAGLLSQVEGQIDAAIAAIENAVMLRPDDRITVDRLVDLLTRANRIHLLDSYAPQLRSALLRRLQEGSYQVGDLSLWQRLCNSSHRRTLPLIAALAHNLEENPVPSVGEAKLTFGWERLQSAIQNERWLRILRSPNEPPGLAHMLAVVEPVIDELRVFLPSLAEQAIGPVGNAITSDRLEQILRNLGPMLGWQRPTLQTFRRDKMLLVLAAKPGLLRMSEGYWQYADLEAQRGLVQIGMARELWNAPRIRCLSPAEIDLIIAGAFEAAGVFNASTSIPDPRTLSAVAGILRKADKGNVARALVDTCESLSSFDFIPGATASELAQSDIRVAVFIHGEIRNVLLAAATLEGFVHGTPAERLKLSTQTAPTLLMLASEAVAEFLSNA
jgi:tetratricopeptide (TPR) repeat protein